MTPQNPETSELLPACRATADRLNRVLDGELGADALAADPHPASCAACRERVVAARLLLSLLAVPVPSAVPAGMADRILSAVKEDRLVRLRRRSYTVSLAAVAAVAASLLVVGWLTKSPPEPVTPLRPLPDIARVPPEVAPEPAPPLRIGDELTKAGLALRDAPRTITDPAGAAPDVLSKLADAFTRPLAPMPDMEPARAALADIPDAARAGFEPVTGTAQKAFSRLMRDVTAIGSKPKS